MSFFIKTMDKINNDFTVGPIFLPLTRFVIPVFVALSLQFLYGAIDLWVVGQYAFAGDVSGVAIGSQIMQTVTSFITGLAVGVAVLVGQQMGKKDKNGISLTIGNGILLFSLVAVLITVAMLLCSKAIIRAMDTPAEAFAQAMSYVQICSAGTIFIVAYNFLCSVLRGTGNSKLPMVSVAIASIFNFLGDLYFVSVLQMGATGAAIATVMAQALSVFLTITILCRNGLPFRFSHSDFCFNRDAAKSIIGIGLPVALQNTLLNLSFLINRSFVNALGVYASSGVGISAKLSYIIMLIPESYMQGISSFAAQNVGAGQYRRARKALLYASVVSFSFCAILFYPLYFHGNLFTSLFSKDPQIICAATEYFRGATIDSLLTAFSFCFIGYFNGCGMTKYVLFQGLVAAFLVRTPVAYYFSHLPSPSLFYISLGSPIATTVQILMHLVALYYQTKFAKRV